MNMRILFVVLPLLMDLALLAQEPVAPAPPPQALSRAEAFRERMVTELALTSEQVVRMDEINARHAEKARDLNRAGQDNATRHAQARNMQVEREAAIKALLTPEQNEKYTAMRIEQRNAGVERHTELKANPHQAPAPKRSGDGAE